MGDEHHRHPPLPVELLDGADHVRPADGVQHGRRLVQDDAPGLHGDDPGDGDALLLAAGEEMGGVLPELIHPHGLQGVVHPAADLLRGDAQILRGEGHILLHHVGHDLVVRVLEHHAHRAAHVQQPGLVSGVHAIHVHFSAGGQQDGVHVLGQGGLSAAVVTQHGHKGPLLDVQVHAVQHHRGHALRRGVGKAQALCFDDRLIHIYLSFLWARRARLYLFGQPRVQRPVAPQGRNSPLSVTGRPSSSAWVCPPKRLETMVSRI